MVSRTLGWFVTGPVAFLIAGLLDLATGLKLAAVYLWRTRVDRRR